MVEHNLAFSEGGLPVGAGLEDLGKGHRSQVGTSIQHFKRTKILRTCRGYIVEIRS